MLKRNVILTSAMAAVICLGVGCEWTGTSSEESWNDAYSWANFSGTYRLYNIISADPGTSGTAGTTTETTKWETARVKDENQGTTAATDTHSGTLENVPVVESSVSITVSGSTFVDQGGGVLSGGNGGTISYETGHWTAKTIGPAPAGSPIRATYSYRYKVVGTDVTPGTPGTPPRAGSELIYFTINQKGNLLTFTDNQGTVYSGRITGANVPQDSRTSANVRLNFEVTAGNGAKIVGTLSGDWSGGATGTLANRSLLGTYSRGKTAVDIQAASGSISITPLPVTTN